LRHPLGLSFLLLLSVVAPGSAQANTLGGQDDGWDDANVVNDFNLLSANAVLGGVTAGLASYRRGGSFRKGFTDGVLGGSLAYLGKRLTSARFSSAGFLGREIAAVGGSIVRNGSLGVGILDTLVLPVGPLRAFVTPSTLSKTRIRLDLHQTARLLAAISEERLALDWGRTFSAGAPVFLTDAKIRGETGFVSGLMGGGVILLSRRGPGPMDRTFAHERVHVAQEDFIQTTAGLSLERWAGQRIGIDRIPLLEHTTLGFGYYALWFPASRIWRYQDRPWEVEAEFLEAR